MKNELSGKIMIKFVGLITKAYSYTIDDGSEDKDAKGIKKVWHKKKIIKLVQKQLILIIK